MRDFTGRIMRRYDPVVARLALLDKDYLNASIRNGFSAEYLANLAAFGRPANWSRSTRSAFESYMIPRLPVDLTPEEYMRVYRNYIM